MPTVIETKVYTFNELSDNAKDKARTWFRENNLDYDWYDSVYYDTKEVGKLLGISIDRIYFSGFDSQGDGACFEGSYSYAKNSVNKIKEYAPVDNELQWIAKALTDIQKLNFYQLSANVKHSGHYYHEYCTSIDVERNNGCVKESTEDTLTTLLRDFMHWIYRRLNQEYDYLNSNEVVDDTILTNEYTFTESGKRFG